MDISFADLATADIPTGAILRTGPSGALAEEPISRAFGGGNMGGFRILGGPVDGYKLAVLFTTLSDKDWPDDLDPATGKFTYFGDNKVPGCPLHETPKGGNELLRRAFESMHVSPARRELVPPFFVVSRVGTNRDVEFHGVAAPGAPDLGENEDLVAIWRTKGSQRFQNYRAVFTLLDVPVIERDWLLALRQDRSKAAVRAPDAWKEWVQTGRYRPAKRRDAR